MRTVSKLFVVSLLFASALAVAHAEVRVQGNADAIRVEAHDATVAQVLTALKQQHDINVRGGVGNKLVSGTFEGPLHYVLARLLEGHDYVIVHNGGALELVVLSEEPPQAAIPAVVVKGRAD